MKIGFSSLVCPGWDLNTIVANAAEFGFDGVELRGLGGELRLAQVPELAANPGATRSKFASAGVELVCLASSCTFDSRKQGERARQRRALTEYVELASALRCPYVRMFIGEIQPGDSRESALCRIGDELAAFAQVAAQHRVTILIENGGDFIDSADLWYLCDRVSHPAIRACWNICTAMMVLDRPTTAIPRISNKLAMVHICDAEFDESGFMTGGYRPLGEGNVEIARAIELLKGICYSGYLMFEWPKLFDPSLPEASAVLPGVSAFLRARVDEEQAILSAYKGDKKKPKFRAPTPHTTVQP